MKHTKLSRILLFILAMVMTLALAGCFWTETPAEKLEAPTLTVDAAVVSWQPVTGAEKYIVFVNGASSETTETSFSLEGREPGAYDVQVQAVKGEEKATSEVATVKITATLSAPEITLSGNSVSWSAVENATGYEVFVNGESRGTVSGTTYAVLENAVGEYKITVKAIGNDIFFASGLSNELTYTVKESAPQPTSLAAPVISIEGGILSWSAVADATTYKIIVNGNEAYKTSETTFTLPITLTEGNYTIVVKASAPTNDLRLDSAASNEVSYSVSALSLDAPILPVVTVDGVEYLFGIDPDGYIRVKPYASVTDLSSYMWYLEKVEGSEYYNIKLHNGKYLAWGNTASDASETIAQTLTEQSEAFWWYIGDRNMDGTFRMFNIAHSNRWASGQFIYYYGHKEGVIKFGDNAVAISFVNRDIPFTPLTALSTPVVEMNGATATWSAVENAVGYDVYVNGEKVATQTETTYTLSTYGTIYVVAKADGETHLNSEKSETKAYSLDLTQPILPIIVEQGVKYIIKIDTDGFVKYTPFDGVSDFETHMWYLEKDGDFYNIKLFDGRYLAWEDGKSSGGHESFAVLKDEAGNASLQWHITITDQGDYAIYNVGHSNRWSGGNWQYNYCIWDGVLKFGNGPKFTFENRDIPFDPDNKYVPPVVEDPDNESFYAWIYYNNEHQTLAAVDENGVVIIGGKYDSVSDYNAYIWYFEAINEGTYDGYYRIKLGDKYLTKTTTNVNGSNGNSAEGQFLALDEGNDAQYWLLVADGDTGFFIYNKTLGTAHKFGEYWGVYKFGGNNSWTFTKTEATCNHSWGEGSVTAQPTCETAGVKTYTCANCTETRTETLPAKGHAFGAWTAAADGKHTKVCANDASHTESENCTFSTDWSTDDNNHWHKCTVCTNVKDNAAHSYDPATETCACGAVNPNRCLHTNTGLASTEAGHYTECKDCHKALSETSAHTAETLAESAATCTATGLTEGKKCSECGYVITAQTSTPAKGHSFGAWTAAADGKHTRVCANDASHIESENCTFSTEWASDDNNHWHKCSVCSNVSGNAAHTYDQAGNKCVCGKVKPVDLTSPILPSINVDGTLYYIEIGADGFVNHVAADGITDLTKYMWYLEADGEHYNIKLFDGRYLAWEDGKSANGHEGFAVLKDEAGNASLQWHIVLTEQGDYAVYNVGHSNKWSGGNWQYYYTISGTSLKFANGGSKITLENKDVAFDPNNNYTPPVIEEPKNESFYAWLYYNNEHQTLAATDADGVVIVGGKYDSVSDYNAYIWYFEAINDGAYDGYYRIMQGGKYLTKTSTNVNGSNGNSAEGQFIALDEANDAQYWLLVADGEGKFFIYNKTYGTAHKFGEVWGVYKFGGNNSWTFTKTVAPTETPDTPDTPATLTDIPADSAFSAWLYYNNDKQTIAGVNADGIVIEGAKYDTVSNHAGHTFIFEPVDIDGTRYYRIRLGDLYLAKATTTLAGSGSDTAEAQFVAFDAASDAQLWILTKEADARYYLYNKSVGTAHKYGEWYGVYKFGGNNSWTFNGIKAVESTPPAVEEEENKSFTAWLHYEAKNSVADVNSDGIVVMGASYDSLDDAAKAAHTWTFEYISEGDYAGKYRIKNADGKYLCNTSNNAGEGKFDTLNEGSTSFVWELVADGEGKYKLLNLAIKNAYGDAFYGEWYDVYKFNGACGAWIFHDVTSI